MDDATTPIYEDKVTVGLDLGDRYTQVCIVDSRGDVVEESRLRTTPEAFRRRFAPMPAVRMVLEAGTHSPWVSRLPRDCGREVYVANPRLICGMGPEGCVALSLQRSGHFRYRP